MSELNFSQANKSGVGFLITRGGAPQFSIAWDGDFQPELQTFDEACQGKLLVDDKPASEYACVEIDGKFVLDHIGTQSAEASKASEATEESL